MDNKKLLVAGAAFLLTGVVAVGAYMYSGSKQAKPQAAQSDRNSDPVEEEEKKEEVAQE